PVDQPSCEYPIGSGVEHLFDGGLWIGGKRGGTTLVTTGAVDVPSLASAEENGFEFTTSDDLFDVIEERSSIVYSPFFHPEAISHQDFVMDYTDSNTTVPESGDLIPEHVPINVSIHQETYAWSYPYAEAFVIFNYYITNTGDEPLTDVYVGLWADLVVRNVNITPPSVGAPFYRHVGCGYVDSLQMAYSFDYDGDPGYTDSYVGLKLLGATPQANDTLYRIKTNYKVWLFRDQSDPNLNSPQTDVERYNKMSSSFFPNQMYLIHNPSNYMTLITTGRFQFLEPDSTINVVFAVICAKKFGDEPTTLDEELCKKNLYFYAGWAETAYNGEDRNGNGVIDSVDVDGDGIFDLSEDINGNGRLDRYVLPTPPSPPRFRVIPGDGQATLYWDNSSEESMDIISKKKDFEGYRLYRTLLGEDAPGRDFLGSLSLFKQYDVKDSLGYDSGLSTIRLAQPVYFEDEITLNSNTGTPDTIFYHYSYVNKNLHNGWQYAFSVVAYDKGDPENGIESLESSKILTSVRIFPGTLAQRKTGLKVGVYPNPYRTRVMWDGLLERDRKIYFYNLPPECEVRIYTLTGDLVDKFQHKALTYRGEDINWFEKYSGEGRLFPGGEHAWDLVTRDDQAIASGLYLFCVKDLSTGEVQTGKFLVIK
ncbi:hypothetical protein ISS37_01775, partial [candidate division KSB1 bacterium]|nr:hypothetical protein [candidate division KSB1 bacterium]